MNIVDILFDEVAAGIRATRELNLPDPWAVRVTAEEARELAALISPGTFGRRPDGEDMEHALNAGVLNVWGIPIVSTAVTPEPGTRLVYPTKIAQID